MTTERFLASHDFVTDYRSILPRHATRVWRKRPLNELRGMVWHQTLSSGSTIAVANYHVGPNHISSSGLPGISYTFSIEKDGKTLLCNALEDVTYSQGDRTKPGDENRLYIAACFTGNFDAPGYNGSDVVSAEQMQAGLRLWLACCEQFGWSGKRLFGHYHFGKPKCPGTVLSQLIESVRAAGEPEFSTYDFETIAGRQAALRSVGHYGGAIDGLWGTQSRLALTAYQKAAGLTVDGIWGPETEEALRRDA